MVSKLGKSKRNRKVNDVSNAIEGLQKVQGRCHKEYL
jgi:hypothetical protein